jgi:hypothetical protein
MEGGGKVERKEEWEKRSELVLTRLKERQQENLGAREHESSMTVVNNGSRF